MKQSQTEVPWRVRDVAFVFLLTLLVGSSAAFAMTAAVEAGYLPARVASALLMPLSPILLGAACLVYVAVRHAHATRLLWGRTQTAARDAGIGVAFGFAAMMLQIVLVAVASSLLGIPVQEAQAPLREAAVDPELRPFLVLGAVVLAPVAEEIFFRGLAYQALRRRAGVTWGALLSAAFFSLVHLSVGVPAAVNLVLFTVIFLVGLALAHLFERQKSLVGPVTMHATFNLLALSALLMGPAS